MAARKSAHLSGSTSAQVAAFAAIEAPPPLTWPAAVKLPAKDDEAAQVLATFNDVLRARSPEHWRPHHAPLIAEYALLSGQIQVMTAVLIRSGALVKNSAQNGFIRNPALDALSMLQSLRGQLSKQLGLSGAFFENDGVARSTNEASQVISKAKQNNYDDLLA